MGLLTGQKHALGRERKSFFQVETTSGTFLKPAGADAVKMLKHDISADRSRIIRADSRQTRSALERITAKGALSWSCEGYVIPNGGATTDPDVVDLLTAAMGTAGGSGAFTLSNSQTLTTLTQTRHMSDVFMESLWGSWVNTMTITAPGGDQPKIKFDGGAMGYAFTGTSAVASEAAGVVTYDVADAGAFSVNSVVAIDTDTDLEVTAAVPATPTFTVTSGTYAGADAIIPSTPAETTAGVPISGLAGSLTVDPAAPFSGTQVLPITAFEMTLNNNVKPFDDEAFEEYASDVVSGYRELTGSVSFRTREDLLHMLGSRERLIQTDFEVVLGSGDAKLTISMNQVEFDWAGVDIPEAEEGIITIPYIALASASLEDEMSMVWG